jgi:hypothetical protein
MGTTMTKTSRSQIECRLFRGSTVDPKPVRSLIVAVVACLTVGSMVGCGGGGGGGDGGAGGAQITARVPPIAIPDTTVTNVFGATLAGGAKQDMIVVVRDSEGGSFFGVYGTNASNDFKVAGLLRGYGNSAPGPGSYHYRGADGVDSKDRLFVLTFDVVMDPSIPSISGTITSPSETRTVSGGAIPSPAYNVNTPATLDAIRGHWDLTTATGAALAIDIGANGVMTGTLGSCTLFDSAIKPSISGKNVFAVTLTARSGNFACATANNSLFGFALAFPSAAGGTQLVIGVEQDWDYYDFLAAAGKR